MLKAILADDEDIVRESMEKWIPWKELGIMLAGSASDGEEAYEMIIRERPDIVITDIRMPKIDGLELIRRVHCRLKDTGFIILSGFGEFSYAQKAMRYGVRHYMLKPARKEDLRDNLLELRNEIESRRRERMNVVAESGEKYSFYLQRGMMIEVLSDPSAIDGIIERSMSLTPFDPSEILTAFSSQVLDVQHFISVMIAAVRKRGIRMPIFPASAGGRVFFILDADPEESRGIAEDMRRAGGVYLGAEKGTPSDLISLFIREAGKAGEAAIYDSDGHREAVKVSSPDGGHTELISRYRAAVGGASDPSLMDDAAAVFRSMDLGEAEALFVRMAINGTDYALLFRELGDVKSIDDLISLARSFTDHRIPGERDPFPADTVRKYINENFQNPEISLKWVSENIVYMNPEYLSRLFQRDVGQRFTDYLNTTRVNAARKLMSIYHQSTVAQIAEKVGYSNPGYFFHIFRRYTGMTPGEYMEKVRKNPEEGRENG